MRGTFRIGRLLGVPVGLHWSLLVMGVLLTVSLAGGRLADEFPATPSWGLWLVGAASALVFFGSVLAHELGHAVAARRFGVVTDAIDLWLLGGMARLRREAPSAAAEFWISSAGPLVSLACGAVLAGAARALDLAGLSGVVPAALAWLAVVNVVLGLFNLLPAAPLDGGRVLQSVLWWRTGDRHRAGAIAARAGQVLGLAVMALGVWDLLRGGFGVLTLLVGWFVFANSGSERAVHVARASIRSLRAGDAMSTGWLRFPTWTPVEGVLAGHKAVRPGDVVVVEDDRREAVGFVTEQQLTALTIPERMQLRLEHLLVPLGTATAAQRDEPLLDVLERVNGLLPVITVWDGTRFVGVVTGHEVREAQRHLDDAGGPQAPAVRA